MVAVSRCGNDMAVDGQAADSNPFQTVRFFYRFSLDGFSGILFPAALFFAGFAGGGIAHRLFSQFPAATWRKKMAAFIMARLATVRLVVFFGGHDFCEF
ncbi:MAG TPA: hypothetical protein VIK59_11450 [Verrucomicrobiae bacterium]